MPRFTCDPASPLDNLPRSSPPAFNRRAILTRGSGGFLALFEAVGVASGFEDVAVVGQAVQQRHGYLGVAKDLYPLPETEVGGDVGRLFSRAPRGPITSNRARRGRRVSKIKQKGAA